MGGNAVTFVHTAPDEKHELMKEPVKGPLGAYNRLVQFGAATLKTDNAAYRSIPMPSSIERPDIRTGAVKFITITRQIGAGGRSLPQRLAEVLNAQSLPNQPSWTAWDRELIEKVADDCDIPVQSVEVLEQSGYSWLDTFISGLGGMPEEFAVLNRVKEAVRALATCGRVILVGHGSVFMSHDLPGGIHIRLVAPLPHRIKDMARRMRLSRQEAAAQLKQSQRNWSAFLKRYWPSRSLAPDTFAATLNTALMDEAHLVRCIAALVS